MERNTKVIAVSNQKPANSFPPQYLENSISGKPTTLADAWSAGDKVYAHILDDDRKINAQKFEAEFYAKPDLREVAPPASSLPTIDLAALIEQIQQSPETAVLLTNILAVQPATT